MMMTADDSYGNGISDPSDRVRRRVIVHGRVQGVWFRDSCRRVATELGVDGWAYNRDDGAVEVLLEGPADPVSGVVAWCQTGPPRARVTSVDVIDEQPDATAPLNGFHIV